MVLKISHQLGRKNRTIKNKISSIKSISYTTK